MAAPGIWIRNFFEILGNSPLDRCLLFRAWSCDSYLFERPRAWVYYLNFILNSLNALILELLYFYSVYFLPILENYTNCSLFSIIPVLCLLSIFLQPFQILYSPLLSWNLYLSLPTTLSIFLLNLHSFLFFRLFCIYTCFYFYRSYESFHSTYLFCTLFSYSSVRLTFLCLPLLRSSLYPTKHSDKLPKAICNAIISDRQVLGRHLVRVGDWLCEMKTDTRSDVAFVRVPSA